MSVHVLEPHDSYAALTPVRLALYGAPRRTMGHILPYDRPASHEQVPRAAPRA